MSALAISTDTKIPDRAETGSSRPKKTKGGYTRQRRGCLTCRQRKKKCDQQLPVCGHCTRLNLVCKREKPRELQSQSQSGNSSSWDDDVVEVPRVSQPQQAHTAGTSNGFDGNVSGQQVSEVLRLAKISEPLDFIRPNPSRAGSHDLVADRRAMMRYYTSTLAVMLSATAENNCFLSVMLPMAFDCPTLLDAMAAWSSAHLALRYSGFENSSLQHRGRVLANLSASLQNNSLSEEMCFAVAMAMCSMETIADGTSGSWAHHLTGAAATLQSKSMQLTDPRASADRNSSWMGSFEGKWLLRNFAYHDILMSISLERRPLLTGDYWTSEDDAQADPYFAFASRILYLTSEISVLNADCADFILARSATAGPAMAALSMDESDPGYKSLVQRTYDIASDLREWQCPSSVSAESPLALLSETYRGAAVICLYRVVRKHFPLNLPHVLPEGVADYISSICDIAFKVPDGSLAECSMLFPLFIAGGEVEDADHIQCIRNRLSSMNKWRRFKNVDAAMEVLEEVWKRKASWKENGEARVVDWRDIVQEWGWQLALT